MKNQNGFTLIELIVVITVGALLVGIAVPAWQSWAPTLHANSCANKLISAMLWTRSRAVTENNPYFISFNNPSANSFRIYDDNNSNGPEAAEILRTSNISDECTNTSFNIIPAITMGPDDNPPASAVSFNTVILTPFPTIMFSPNGRLSESGTIYLASSVSPAIETTRVLQSFSTGKIRILKCGDPCNTADSWF